MTSLTHCIKVSAKEFIEAHPELADRCSSNDDEADMLFSVEGSDEGFDIHLSIMGDDEIIVHAGCVHFHRNQDDMEQQEFVREQFRCIRSLLSPLARIIEFRAGAYPYKYRLEFLHDDRWEHSDTMGTLFFNYFGKRTQRIIQNTVLLPDKC